jgi:hypothetical protein
MNFTENVGTLLEYSRKNELINEPMPFLVPVNFPSYPELCGIGKNSAIPV